MTKVQPMKETYHGIHKNSALTRCINDSNFNHLVHPDRGVIIPSYNGRNPGCSTYGRGSTSVCPRPRVQRLVRLFVRSHYHSPTATRELKMSDTSNDPMQGQVNDLKKSLESLNDKITKLQNVISAGLSLKEDNGAVVIAYNADINDE